MSSYSQAVVAETIGSVTLPSLSVMASDAPTQADCGNVSASNTPPGTDSGYASQASCAEVMEGWPVPARQKLSLHKTLKMKVFPRPISQPLWSRFYDLVELFDSKLETYLSPSHQRATRRWAIQFKMLGEDETTAKPWFLIKCDPTLSKRIRQFFNRPSIRCHYQATAENPTQPNLEIFVVKGPPTRIANFHIQIGVPDVQQFERAGYSCSIKVTHSGGVAFGTFGGLVKVLVADRGYRIRGMTVGHIFLSSEEDKLDEDSETDSDNDIEEGEEDDEDYSSDSQQTFEPGVGEGSRTGYFEDSRWESSDGCNIPYHYAQRMEDTTTWSNLGRRFVDISKTGNSDARNFDWALITIDDPSTYSGLVAENPIHKLGLAGELKVSVSHIAGESRTVMLSGASSGRARGVISLSWSYLQLPPWKRMLKTYTLTLDIGGSELLPGDCGSWVVDCETHEVYGYVVATDYFGEAYVIPMNFTFEDMKTQLSADRILFPTREEIDEWLLGIPNDIPEPPEHASSVSREPTAQSSALPVNLPVPRDEGYYSSMSGSQTSSKPSMEIEEDDFEDLPLSKLPIEFGFEAGDFHLAFKLVTAVSAVLRNDIFDSPGYRALTSQVCALENSLDEVRRLEVTGDQKFLLAALRQSSSQCQRTLHLLWKKIQVEPSSRANTLTSIDWSSCEESDLLQLTADLLGHTKSIQFLLVASKFSSSSSDKCVIESSTSNTPQQESNRSSGSISAVIHTSPNNSLIKFRNSITNSKKSSPTIIQLGPSDSFFSSLEHGNKKSKSLPTIIQSFYSGFKDVISGSLDNVSRSTSQIFETTSAVFRVNIEIFKLLKDIQEIPAARSLDNRWYQEPVLLVDALGATCPIPLELANSWEMLNTIIDARFKGRPGEAKVRRKEYILQDFVRKRDIDQSFPLVQGFMPGTRITMTMVFRFTEYKDPICPRCGCKNNDETSDNEYTCQQCGIYYQYILEMLRLTTLSRTRRLLRDTIDPNDSNDLKPRQIIRQDRDESRYITDPNDSNGSKSSQIIRQDQDESRNEEDDMAVFQRVRIVMPPLQKELAVILQKMQALEDAWPFLTPMLSDSDQRLPIDFSAMESKIKKGEYPTAEAFIKDAACIFTYYKDDEGEIGDCARRTEAYMWELFADTPEWANEVAELKYKYLYRLL